MTIQKKCIKCSEVKNFSEFRLYKGHISLNTCKTCERAQLKLWKQNNKNKVSEYNKLSRKKKKIECETLDIISLAMLKATESKEVNYNRQMTPFVAECYLKLSSGARGSHIETKILSDLKLKRTDRKLLSGDFKSNSNNFEIKTSYMNTDSKMFNIVHIRPWHDIDYYVICLIDCDENFKQDFYVVPKNIVNVELDATYMNGTREDNEKNIYSELRTSFKKNSSKHNILKENNVLDDTTYESMVKFVKRDCIKYKSAS